MIIYLEQDIEYSPSPSVAFVLSAGSQLTPINPYYLEREVLVAFPGTGVWSVVPAGCGDKFFFIYTKGLYVAIPKDYVSVPKSIGWKYNL